MSDGGVAGGGAACGGGARGGGARDGGARDGGGGGARDAYAQAGVDIEEGAKAVRAIKAAVQGTYRPEVIGDIGGFGGLFDASALKGLERPVLVSATDGVGTKLELAKRFERHGSVGIDLVAMCVNDLVVSGAHPLFFLDYLAVEHLQAEFAAEVVGGIAAGCRQAGCALIGGEMAEHPQVMQADDYDLAGFAVGVVDYSQMLGPARVQAGDAIIGLASTGFHSNGYSLIRKSFSDKLSDAELMSGQVAEGGSLAGGGSLAEGLLRPTRIYVPEVLGLLKRGLPLHAAAHITGGGITENLNRALPDGLDAVIELGSWPVPELISRVVTAIGLGPDEALRTFNMGIGMALVVAAAAVEAVLAALAEMQAEWAADTDGADGAADTDRATGAVGATPTAKAAGQLAPLAPIGCWRIGEVVPSPDKGRHAGQPGQVLYSGKSDDWMFGPAKP